jgi:signal transduction histidine kinase
VSNAAPDWAEALRELRLLTTDALLTLHLAVSPHERPKGAELGRALSRLADDFSAATGTCAQVRVRGDAACIAPRCAQLVLDIAQEAFSNVTRHARASVVVVALHVRPDGVELDIVDDGVDLSQRQVAGWRSSVELGLRRLARTARGTGGRVTIVPMQPRGLRIHLSAPLAARSRS